MQALVITQNEGSDSAHPWDGSVYQAALPTHSLTMTPNKASLGTEDIPVLLWSSDHQNAKSN